MQQLPKALQPLTAYDQFLIYKLVWNGKKYDKIPLNAHSLEAVNPHDPHNQIDAQTACNKAVELGDGYGVAFAFSDRDPFWFLDIDNCLVNGTWSDLAQSLINRLAGCAVEVSQSGTGLHLFGTGVLEPHGCKNSAQGLELYHTDRFVALTGVHASGDASLDCTVEINKIATEYFHKDDSIVNAQWTTGPRADWNGPTNDEELIAKAVGSNSTRAMFGTKASFADLWNRNVNALAEFYPDDEPKEYGYSEADAALAQHLAFWTGCNCERMLRLMWRSGLVRDKWEVHKSYLQMTILTAVGRQQDVYSNKQQVTTEPLEDIDALLDRIQTEGADVKKARVLMSEIAQAEMSEIDKELCANKLVDTMHTANIDIKKSTVLKACMGKTANAPALQSFVPFPDLKANGHPKATKENVIALMEYLQVTCRYNLMSKEVEINIPNTSYTVDNALNCSLNDIVSHAARHNMTKGAVEDNVLSIADTHCYNPVKEWLDCQQWDGVDRLEPLVKSLDPKNYNLAYWLVRRWLISAVAAVYKPDGVAAQGMIVLQGDQYLGKSRWFWSLLPYREWGKESHILNPHDKDSVKQAVSRWMVELGELDATFKKSDIEALKGFITRAEDELRLPYGRLNNKYPRRTVFFGTVNPEQYLHDDTGNRRYWSISCGLNLTADHGVDIGQLWGQVKVMFDSGEQWWLTHEEHTMLNDYNKEFKAANPVEELIAVSYDPNAERTRPMTATEILQEIGFDKPTQLQLRQAGVALREVMDNFPRTTNGRKVYDMPHKLSKIFKMLT